MRLPPMIRRISEVAEEVPSNFPPEHLELPAGISDTSLPITRARQTRTRIHMIGPSNGTPLLSWRTSTPRSLMPWSCWASGWCCGGMQSGSGAASRTSAPTGWHPCQVAPCAMHKEAEQQMQPISDGHDCERRGNLWTFAKTFLDEGDL